MSAKLASVSGSDAAALKASIDSVAPAAGGAGGGGRGGGGGGAFGNGGGAAPAATLERASAALLAAAMGMQNADMAPTARDIATATAARAQATVAMARWVSLRAKAQNTGAMK